MRIILKFTILTILSVVFLTPALVSAQEKTDPGSAKEKKKDDSITVTIPPAAKKTEEKTTPSNNDEGIEFPEIKGWERGDIRTFPSAALGYSIAYQSPDGGAVTIYVYNGGLKTVPSDVNDKAVKAEIDRAKNEITQIGKMGIYEGVKEVKNDTVTLGGTNGKVKALRSLFYFKVRGDEVDSEIYLFSYKNNFIKIRSTRPKSENGAENKAFSDLLADIDKLFAN
jgi:hypothetical protein